MTMLNLAAIDLGAESGRLVLGSLDGERVRTEELHRFDSRPVRLPTGLHTDVAHIWREIGVGLQASHANEQRPGDGRFKPNGLFATFGGV